MPVVKGFPCGSIQCVLRVTNVPSVSMIPMSHLALQYVLLIAIAHSQIFGGISCCCLGRTLFSNRAVAGSHQIEDAVGENNITKASKPTGKCPKCSSRNATGRLTTKDASAPCSAISEDGQCRCKKLLAYASAPHEPLTVDSANHVCWLPVLGFAQKRLEATLVELRRFEVPIRFGGRSWQSIACVWKN